MTDSPNDDLAERGAAIFQSLRSTVAHGTADDARNLQDDTERLSDPTISDPHDPASEVGLARPELLSTGHDEASDGLIGTVEDPQPSVLIEEPAAGAPLSAAAHPAAQMDPGSGEATGSGSQPDDGCGNSEFEAARSVSRETSGEAEANQQPTANRAESPSSESSLSTPSGTMAAQIADPPPGDAPVVLPGPTSFSRALPRVMAIANQKGGVGKTTTAVNLSACLAELGHRVLVVDLDPQGNATTGLGVNPRNLQYSMYDVLLQDRGLDDCIEPTSVKNLFVAPSSLDLAGAEIELVPVFSRELKLKRAIDAIIEDYDYVLIDCPPSLGLLTVNGLAAASEVVVPIQCEYYALEGLGQLLRNVNLVQRNLNPTLEVSGIVLVMFDGRTKLSGEVVHEVRQHFGEKVCRTVVPRTVRLSEAPSFGQPIVAFDPSSRGAIAYRSLAKELHGGTS